MSPPYCALASPCSGEAIPAHGFGFVLEDAPPVGVHDPEEELRFGKALLGGEAVPFHGFGFVLEDALAEDVHEPEEELRVGTALLRS